MYNPVSGGSVSGSIHRGEEDDGEMEHVGPNSSTVAGTSIHSALSNGDGRKAAVVPGKENSWQTQLGGFDLDVDSEEDREGDVEESRSGSGRGHKTRSRILIPAEETKRSGGTVLRRSASRQQESTDEIETIELYSGGYHEPSPSGRVKKKVLKGTVVSRKSPEEVTPSRPVNGEDPSSGTSVRGEIRTASVAAEVSAKKTVKTLKNHRKSELGYTELQPENLEGSQN